jgi:hypothetical protein
LNLIVSFFLLQFQFIYRAAHPLHLSRAYVRVPLGCADIRVPQQFLDEPHINAIFQQMGGKRMAQCVDGSVFADASLAAGLLEGYLHCPHRDVNVGPPAGE